MNLSDVEIFKKYLKVPTHSKVLRVLSHPQPHHSMYYFIVVSLINYDLANTFIYRYDIK